jgi:hypothetical protein
MELDQTNLRIILKNIFQVDEKYIIPLQGNWFNPQNILSKNEKPSTWIAFRIRSNKPTTEPFSSLELVTINEQVVKQNWVNQYKIAIIDLQFVGSKAEKLANGISLWIKRTDVKEQFETVKGKLMSDELSVIPKDFFQEGLNSIISYNVQIKIYWLYEILTTQEVVEEIEEITGEIN